MAGARATPNLDGLAARGARFTFAHAHAVVTLVSHASMLTGKYPYEHGIRDNTGYRLDAEGADRGDAAEGARLLHRRVRRRLPARSPIRPRRRVRRLRRSDDDAPGRPREVSERERPADAVVKSALDWIGAQPGQVVRVGPRLRSARAVRSRRASSRRAFPAIPTSAKWRGRTPRSGRCSIGCAACRGRRSSSSRRDHGESLGEHGERTHSLFAYEATLRVPLIVAEIDAGARPTERSRDRRSTRPVRHVDLLPTMLASAGAPAPATSGSRRCSTRSRPVAAPERPSYFEAMSAAVTRGWAPLRGVLVGREKYIDLPIVELYDLAGGSEGSSPTSSSRAPIARG